MNYSLHNPSLLIVPLFAVVYLPFLIIITGTHEFFHIVLMPKFYIKENISITVHIITGVHVNCNGVQVKKTRTILIVCFPLLVLTALHG